MSKSCLSKNNELRKGDFLISNNGEYKAVFQEDGNFVIYGKGPLWSSDTYGLDVFRLCMQADGDLVMYNEADQDRWRTDTSRPYCDVCSLDLTDDGKLVLRCENVEVWSSDESKGILCDW